MEIQNILFLIISMTVLVVGSYYLSKTGLTNSLYQLHLRAYRQYRYEVLRGGKLYKRFVADFCNEHVFICSENSEITASQLNQKNKNFNIVRELLCERPDLVDKYFIEEHFSLNDFYELIREFNTTETSKNELTEDDAAELGKDSVNIQTDTSIIQDSILSSTEIPCLPIEEVGELKKIVGSPNPFKSSFSDKEIEILTDCINEAHIFTTTISPTILKSFFICTLDGALKSNNNSLLVYLMMNLNKLDYITNNWQSVIASKQLIYKKTKDNYLTKTDLSTPTEKVQCILPRGYEIIDKYIKELEKG